MMLNKSLIVISITILSCSLYPFDSTTTRQAFLSMQEVMVRSATVPKYVLTSIYAHKYLSAAALVAGGILLFPTTRRAITGLWRNWFRPNEQVARLEDHAQRAQKLKRRQHTNDAGEVKSRKARLHRAEAQWKPTQVHTFVQTHETIGIVDSQGQTLLHRAAERGQLETVQAQIADGAHVNARDKSQQTPLHKAAMRGHVNVIEVLAKAGGDFNLCDANGKSPLHYTAEFGHCDAAKALIYIGADLNQRDNNGKTPLHCAVENDIEKEVVRLLFQSGVNVLERDNHDDDAFMYSLKLNTVDIARFIMQAAHINIDGIRCNWHYLEFTVYDGLEQVVRNLIALGVDVNQQFIHRQTALHIASKRGHNVIAAMLLQAHANVNVVNSNGETPLHEAAASGSGEIVRLLIDAGAQVNAQEERQKTPLHLAAQCGRDEAVKTLIDENANVSAIDVDGVTPLHRAAAGGHATVVRRLVNAGAQINAQDQLGCTPLDLATINNHRETAATLIQLGAIIGILEPNKARHNESNQPFRDRARVNAGAGCRKTPLHLAVQSGKDDDVDELIEEGANVGVIDENGQTPLHMAAIVGNEEVVRDLIDAGALINAQDHLGCTPLDLATINHNVPIAATLTHLGGEKVLLEGVMRRNHGGNQPLPGTVSTNPSVNNGDKIDAADASPRGPENAESNSGQNTQPKEQARQKVVQSRVIMGERGTRQLHVTRVMKS